MDHGRIWAFGQCRALHLKSDMGANALKMMMMLCCGFCGTEILQNDVQSTET
jgi:hypothetical protein